MTVNFQKVIAYGSIVMAVLTQALAGIHLPMVASAILGAFGVLLHPDTSFGATGGSQTPPLVHVVPPRPAAPPATTQAQPQPAPVAPVVPPA